MNNEVHIAIISITGKVVFNSTHNNEYITKGKITLNLKHLPTGKYIANITVDNQSTSRPVIIVN